MEFGIGNAEFGKLKQRAERIEQRGGDEGRKTEVGGRRCAVEEGPAVVVGALRLRLEVGGKGAEG